MPETRLLIRAKASFCLFVDWLVLGGLGLVFFFVTFIAFIAMDLLLGVHPGKSWFIHDHCTIGLKSSGSGFHLE